MKTHMGLMLLVSLLSPAFAFDDRELQEALTEFAAKQGITDPKQVKALEEQVRAVLVTKEKLAFGAVQEPCRRELERLCSGARVPGQALDCMRRHRAEVGDSCEQELKRQIGSKPFPEAQLVHGVLLPKGSTFFYDPRGNVLGAIAASDFEYRGIRFRKGQVRFHETGVSVAGLVEDQLIDGIKYRAEGIGPFFDEAGNVVNATLAEETRIGDVVFRASTQIQLYSRSKVRAGIVARETTVGGRTFAAGSFVSFDEAGTFAW